MHSRKHKNYSPMRIRQSYGILPSQTRAEVLLATRLHKASRFICFAYPRPVYVRGQLFISSCIMVCTRMHIRDTIHAAGHLYTQSKTRACLWYRKARQTLPSLLFLPSSSNGLLHVIYLVLHRCDEKFELLACPRWMCRALRLYVFQCLVMLWAHRLPYI